MKMRDLIIAALLCSSSVLTAQNAPAAKQESTPPVGVLKSADAQKLIPPIFFYAGQSAPVQARNSGAFRTPSGKMALAALVDNSGYSSAIAEKYQGFLITDGKVRIGGNELSPGAYGIGALADGSFVVTDLGANNLFAVRFATDDALKRPVPLKFAADGSSARLYLGKKYVTLEF
jgi:hypothetical protein